MGDSYHYLSFTAALYYMKAFFLQLIKSHSHLKTAGYACDKSAAFVLRSAAPQQRGIMDVPSTVYLH